jgi:hypothetical protein
MSAAELIKAASGAASSGVEEKSNEAPPQTDEMYFTCA